MSCTKNAIEPPPQADAPLEIRRMLPSKVAAQLIGVSVRTLEDWRNRKPPTGPVFYRISPRQVGYLESDINAWLLTKRAG